MIDVNEFQLTIISAFISYLLIGFVFIYNKQVSNNLNYFHPLTWLFFPSLLIIQLANKINVPNWVTFTIFVPIYLCLMLILFIINFTIQSPLEFE